MLIPQVSIALYHLDAAPASKLLYRPQIRPRIASREAKVYLKTCGVTPLSLARRPAAMKAVLLLRSLLTPSFFRNTLSLLLRSI